MPTCIIEVERGELDEAAPVRVEVTATVRLGCPATYWEPEDPAEVNDMEAVVVESWHPGFPVGSTIILTEDETEKAEALLIGKAAEEGRDSGFEPPDEELPDCD